MTKKMLIDATHEEETRVAVVDGHRLAEFDYESKYRKALKGSIFLAKVTRVEPSLQAAFVNFGGNRHGFLPFSEIHPDYFRIPIADREALIAEQEAAMREDEEKENEEEEQEIAQGGEPVAAESEGPETVEDEDKDVIEEIGGNIGEDSPEAAVAPEPMAEIQDFSIDQEQESEEDAIGNRAEEIPDDEDSNIGNADSTPGEEGRSSHEEGGRRNRYGRGRSGRGRGGRHQRGGGAQHRSRRTEKYDDEEQSGSDRFRFSLRRKYKIQEVIKRGQIMLVQVSKEERGNKGAAVSTYLSLPGRYCVLMPNSPRGGGVSRKIANYQERAKMKEILKDMEVPKGMSVIVRTAGVSRTKAEVKRDLDYLMRLWDNIRELTLQSSAPAMVYEEANLIKRAVRDLYGRDVEEIHVAGEEGFKQARDFMKMMMPSHVKKVHHYKEEDVPLFRRYKVESQIAEIGEPQVTLPSGGYLVINPTEALISIDVNSGKSTKERHIEETATRTNMEAAEEVARQLRMRDLGGLIVIDFIDMEDRRNNAKVERKMREALSTDRARIQMGRISSFGLMELSRQRLNPSLTESQYETCSRCSGLGRVRTADATSIMVLRAIEDEGMKGRAAQVIVHVPHGVALYILNNKRKHLSEIEARYKLTVMLRVDETVGVSSYRVEMSKPLSQGGETQDSEESEDGDQSSSSSSDSQETENRERNNNRSHDHRGPDNRGGGEQRSRGGRRRGRRGGRNRGGRDGESFNRQQGGGGQNQGPANILDDDSAIDTGSFESQPRHHSSRPDRAERPASEPREPAQAESAPEQFQQQSAPSNDYRQSRSERSPEVNTERAPREYEKINEAPGEKKKGWWNRLGGE